MQKKRILVVAASLGIGGAEKVARDIGLYGDPEQYEHHYIVFGDEVGAYENQIIAHGGKVFHIDSPGKSYISYIRTLHQVMKENHYHVVHAHTMFNCGWVMLAGKKAGIPVRVSHSHSALDDGTGFVKKLYEGIMRRLILSCSTDLVACGETAGIRLFGKKNYYRRGNLILNGIDLDLFRFNHQKRKRIREQLGWQDSFLIGHTGHLAEVKNQVFLLELMPAILEKCPNARLLMLGEGKDRPMLEKRIHDLNLTDKVRMPGNVDNVADYLCAMDVFAFPSFYEGMPLSIIEVQANGLPCVLSAGVPKDVFLTDLIKPLSLTDDPRFWVDALIHARRNKSEQYTNQLSAAGLDIKGAMEKIYQIYERTPV